MIAGPDKRGRDFEASDLGRLPLLSAVIKESLRLCHPVPFGGIRQVVQEGGTDLCGYSLPKVRPAADAADFGWLAGKLCLSVRTIGS